MTTKQKPATALPWEPSEKYTPIAPYIQSEQDEDYACHAANAYAGNIELLREAMRALEWHSAQKHALSNDSPIVEAIKVRLHELGED